MSHGTTLKNFICAEIARSGPMRLDHYMELCLGHTEYGYYQNRDPFGRLGDFVTAPEISQIFGELIGVWLILAWQAMGQPKTFHLIELGPGRGTLMADIVRILPKMPDCARAAQIHLVETSPVLQQIQKIRLETDCSFNITWHKTLETLPAGPFLLIANEFFDALAIRQYEFFRNGWYERLVFSTEDGHLHCAIDPHQERVLPLPIGCSLMPQDGDVFEHSSAREAYVHAMGQRLKASHGMALLIDYGHTSSAFGDTIQSVKNHQSLSFLDQPGESDLTSHVDFEALRNALIDTGSVCAPILTQGFFLKAMGLEERLEALQQSMQKNFVHSTVIDDISSAARRLVDRDQMGEMFKIMLCLSPSLSPTYPFEAVGGDPRART